MAKTKTAGHITSAELDTIKWRDGNPIVNPMLAQKIITRVAVEIGEKNIKQVSKVNLTAHLDRSSD